MDRSLGGPKPRVRERLEAHGYRVAVSPDGLDGRMMASRERPALVLLDERTQSNHGGKEVRVDRG